MARNSKKRLKDIARVMNELVQEREAIKMNISDVLLKDILTDANAELLDDCTTAELHKIGKKLSAILPEIMDEVRNEKTGNKQVEEVQETTDTGRDKTRKNLFDTAVIPDDFAEKYGRIVKPAPDKSGDEAEDEEAKKTLAERSRDERQSVLDRVNSIRANRSQNASQETANGT